MDKIIAVLVLIVVVVLLVGGEMYLNLDKNRSMANAMLKKILPELDAWVQITDRLFSISGSETMPGYAELSKQYHALTKKQYYERVTIINSILPLAKNAIAEGVDDARINAIGNDLSRKYFSLADTHDDYNVSVTKLNYKLDGKLMGTVGKLFHFKHMELLADLSVL